MTELRHLPHSARLACRFVRFYIPFFAFSPTPTTEPGLRLMLQWFYNYDHFRSTGHSKIEGVPAKILVPATLMQFSLWWWLFNFRDPSGGVL